MRVPTEDDIAAIARISSEHWPEPADEDLVRSWWSALGFDRERDARVEANAYAHVDAMDESRTWINLRGHPSADLVDWALERAHENEGRILSGAWDAHEAVLSELRGRGFRLVRHSFRMSISLDKETPAPLWPEGVRVRMYRDGDARAFYETGEEAFADTWEPIETPYEEWAHWVLDTTTFDPELWFLAEASADVAGFAICKVHPSDSHLGWIQILGVRRPWRGRGVGRALLLTALHAFRERGLGRAGLGVDAENPTGATRLYESVGMHAVDRFEIYEKDAS